MVARAGTGSPIGAQEICSRTSSGLGGPYADAGAWAWAINDIQIAIRRVTDGILSPALPGEP